MIVRNFKLYLHAGATSPLVINANQYDHNEQWVFELYDSNNQKYTPSTGAIVGIKSDGLGIINTATVDSNGRVVVNETEQMTAAAGRAEFELMIDSAVHGTANFYVLVEPKPGDNADLSETDISMIEQAIEAASTIKPYGSPLVASTVAGMTDHDKVYVYVGSETGYTSGNWYYWDGSAWTSGGVYNSVAVQTDTTLTLSGVAADAKKTGDEISDLKSQIGSDELTAEGDNIIDAINLLSENGGGISSNATDLLITILRNGFYQTDQSANITALNTALRQSGITYYSIVFSGENAEYTGVPSVRENKPLTGTIACTEGYQFSSVQITMGGVNITETAYTSNNSRSGSISITQVTGDVAITVVTTEWTGDDITSEVVWNEGVWINGSNISSHSNQAATSPIDVQGYSTLVIYSARSHSTIGAPNVLGLATESATSGSKINNNEGKQYWNSSGGQYPSSLTFNVETYNYVRIGTPKGEYQYIGVRIK